MKRWPIICATSVPPLKSTLCAFSPSPTKGMWYRVLNNAITPKHLAQLPRQFQTAIMAQSNRFLDWGGLQWFSSLRSCHWGNLLFIHDAISHIWSESRGVQAYLKTVDILEFFKVPGWVTPSPRLPWIFFWKRQRTSSLSRKSSSAARQGCDLYWIFLDVFSRLAPTKSKKTPCRAANKFIPLFDLFTAVQR